MASEIQSILPDTKPEKTFKSSIGVALSCLGAAVGTGNIWRYPRIVANNTGENGALAFLLIWFLFLFTWSIPLLLIEYGAGRYTKCATILTFKKMVGPRAMWCGAFIGFVNFAIASYYAVICGWCAYYFGYFIANGLPSELAESRQIFTDFAEASAWPVLFQAFVIALGGACVFAGVRSIEPVMIAMVPLLLILMLVSFIYSLTLEYSSIGIKHLFNMDWEVFKRPKTWIEALTQNAWDTGAAQGILLVYATYLGKQHGVVRYGTVIPSINNFLSFLMAITMFSTIFSVQITLDPSITVNQVLDSFAYNAPGNTGLTFIWIPILYSSLSIGRGITVIFFLCLFLAGFSSQISLIEASCHQLVDLKIPRKVSVPVICFLMFLFGLGSTLNIHFLVNQDFVWGSAIVISGSFLLFMVYSFGVDKFRTEIVNNYGDGSDWKLPRLWNWIIWFLIPVEIVAIFIWWVASSVMDQENIWYVLSDESLLSALLQWAVVILVVLALSFGYLRYGEKLLPNIYLLPGLSPIQSISETNNTDGFAMAVDFELDHIDAPHAMQADSLPGNDFMK